MFKIEYYIMKYGTNNFFFVLVIIGVFVVAYYITITYHQTKDDMFEKALYCETEEQCAMTNYPLGDCCQKCDAFPINKQAFYDEEQQRKETCNNVICPEFRCLWSVENVTCINNKCMFIEQKR